MKYLYRSRLDTNRFFNRCVFRDRNDLFSDSFHSLATAQETLTFDESFLDKSFKSTIETPFKEIWRAAPEEYCADVLPTRIPTYFGSYESYLDELERTLERVLLRMDPAKKYLMAHSSGSDSRIISGTMARLKRQGKMSFDNVLFHCWCTFEADSFRQIMATNGWTNLSFVDDSQPDVYNIGRLDIPCEGWNPYTYQMDFWGDLDPREYVLVSGAQETYSVPYERWVYASSFFNTRGESIHRMANVFQDVFFPFLTHDMLNITMSMPREWKNIKDSRIGRDKVRTDLVERLGLIHIPVQAASCRFNVSPERRQTMLDAYERGKFKKNYGIQLDEDDLFKVWGGWNSCLWSFAVTVYEPLM
ncbi:hypothetical protein [Caballeronia insecticola]|uniref:Uncharacterized protein n=1 Tax=Caballeronia insecticola TaxID=758793 RepID=A0A060PKI6_9BURK|nr:hypothetical protein [Caballeronia insecticola]BAO94086.1 hypothetical protein BRPE64_ECDS02040 [Caballeronia insecticola]